MGFLSRYNREKLELELAKMRLEVALLRRQAEGGGEPFAPQTLAPPPPPPPALPEAKPASAVDDRSMRMWASLAASGFSAVVLRFDQIRVLWGQAIDGWTAAGLIAALVLFIALCWSLAIALVQRSHSPATAALLAALVTVVLHAVVGDLGALGDMLRHLPGVGRS